MLVLPLGCYLTDAFPRREWRPGRAAESNSLAFLGLSSQNGFIIKCTYLKEAPEGNKHSVDVSYY